MFRERFTLCLLGVAVIFSHHQGSCFQNVPATTMVACFEDTATSSSAVCSGSGPLGMMLAHECCSGTGNTFTFGQQCLGCLFFGFDVTNLEFSAANKSQTYQVPFVLRKKVPDNVNTGIRVTSSDFSEPSLLKINEYVTVYPNAFEPLFFIIPSSTAPSTRLYDITISNAGNSKALEDPLTFSLTTEVIFGAGDFGVVIYPDRVNITVQDLDILVFSFDRAAGSVFTEGDEGGVIVERNSIRPSRPVQVFVTARLFTRSLPLMEDEYEADAIDFYPGETEVYTFTEDGDFRIQMLFSAREDNIVEPGHDVFEVVLATNESAVRIADPFIQKLFIEDDDDFRIGFKETQLTKIEGESIILTVLQTNDVIGQLRVNTTLDRPNINNIPNSAGIDLDYNFTDAGVTQMQFNETTRRLIPITFYIGTTFVDNILEGAETFNVRVVQTNTLQVGDDPFVGVTIVDATPGLVRLQRREYNITENAGVLLVCAEVISANLDLHQTTSLSVSYDTIPGTAQIGTDFSPLVPTFTFRGSNPVACVQFILIDNLIREDLHEDFTIRLRNYTGSDFTNLRVDTTPSTVTIIDDDQALISFERDFAEFSEDAGNQDIFVRISGGSLSSSLPVVIYDINTGIEVGRVEFIASFFTSQRVSFSFSNPDNQIALEANRTFVLGFRDVLDVGIGSPSMMTVVIYDDDVVSVTFGAPEYTYIENHGTVRNIGIRLSHQIAQDLEVFYSGNLVSRSEVRMSGVEVFSSVEFPADSPAGSIQLIDEFDLLDDDWALELDEIYSFEFLNASVLENVILGNHSRVIIQDDDVVQVDFESSSYSFSEGAADSNGINLMLSTSIARPLQVVVSGGPGSQSSSVVISGSAVSSTIMFPTGQAPVSLPSFSITDDDVALETVERYQLVFSSAVPSDDVVFGDPATILITDDDDLVVRFNRSMYVFNENDGETFDRIAVVLSNRIAQDVYIDVDGDNDGQPDTVVPSGFMMNETIFFEAFTDTSRVLPSHMIMDDNVALETPETFDIELSTIGPLSDRITFSGTGSIVINDNDVVTVSFLNDTYSFIEDELGMIQLILSTAIARGIDLTVNGASGGMPNVINNGPTVNHVVQFQRDGDLVYGFPIKIEDDDFALEELESYEITIRASTPLNGLLIGDPATIEVMSEDVVEVNFVSNRSVFGEIDSIGSIGLGINLPIAQDLIVSVFGESQPAAGVEVSGVVVNNTVTFTSRGMSRTFDILINDDIVALENDEVYEISFTRSSPIDGVILGSPTEVVITDNDQVTVQFSEPLYTFSEDSGQSSGVVVGTSNPVAIDFTIVVSGGPGQQPNTVSVSGSPLNVSLTFGPSINRSLVVPSFQINDDEIGLETVESYPIQIGPDVDSVPSDVIFGSDATIRITDNDVTVVSVIASRYNFTEGDRTANIWFMLDRIVYQDAFFAISGESPQQNGVFNNGPNINFTILNFVRRGPLSIPFNLAIGDDFIARENDEVFSIGIVEVAPEFVAISPTASSTTIIISDDDDAVVSFTSSMYEFLENAGNTTQVKVSLDTEVAQEFTVRVSGDPSPVASDIKNSGSVVNQLLTFQAFDSTQSNLLQTVIVEIVDDEVSGEPDQSYTIELVDVPSDVALDIDTATIVIDDDDQSGLRFLPFMGPFFESTGVYPLTVILTGEISSPVSVDVVDETGTVIDTVTFFPMPGVTSQQRVVNVTVDDDDVALEEDEAIGFRLTNPQGAELASPSAIEVVIKDDDVVMVEFVSLSYNYSENHGEVNNIQVQLSKEIAGNLSVTITGAPGTQALSVIISGVAYSSNLYFPAGTGASVPVSIAPFTIMNDFVGLETLEQYQLAISVPSGNIVTGQPTTISISDEDVVTVSFLQNGEEVFEGIGEIGIPLEINRPVAVPLVVRVSGVTTPLMAGVSDSGSNVSELITFPDKTDIFVQNVYLNITNDDVSGEPIQEYYLEITEEPVGVAVAPNPTFNIRIIDDDQAGVRFLPFVGPVFESAEMHNLTVILDGEISAPVSVTVNDSMGNTVGVVTFHPIPGQSSQEAIVTITFQDDRVALEPVEELRFILIPSEGDVALNGPSTTIVEITDDDVVEVNFNRDTYSFDEGQTGSIEIRLSTEIASNLAIFVRGATMPQDGVANSGPTISQQFTFTPSSSTNSFLVSATSDSFALENLESYPISLENVNSIPNVILGPQSTIQIRDTNVVNVRFSSPMVEYSEDSGSQIVDVIIDSQISTDLVVDVFGVSEPAEGVELSGEMVNETVQFQASGPLSASFVIDVRDDDIGLEVDEVFEIEFTDSTPTERVVLGDRMQVTITDDDVVMVSFADMPHTFQESNPLALVNIVLNRRIAQNISVEVSGVSTDSPTVNQSGLSISRSVYFVVGDNDLYVPLRLILRDDEDALEDTEIFTLSFDSPSPSTVQTGPNARIMITDDDIVSVNFENPTYTFTESQQDASIRVMIDRTIFKPLVVFVFGMSMQEPGISVSGETINTTVSFLAQGSMLESFSVGIMDDSVALEGPESYPVQFTSSAPSTNVNLGPNATITITDDDGTRIIFNMTQYTFNEDDGTVTVRILLTDPVSQDVSVTVRGGVIDNPAVSHSAPEINDTIITFRPDGPLYQDITFTLQDDEDGLESPEVLILSLGDPSVSTIDVSSTTSVMIIDNDVVEVRFVNSTDPVSESAKGKAVWVEINRNIFNDLVVFTSGATSPSQDNVLVSGRPFNGVSVMFLARGSTLRSFNVSIEDDSYALEDDEQYTVMFVSSSPANNVQLGPSTSFMIQDDDDVMVNFVLDEYSALEGEGLVEVFLVITNPVIVQFTVNVAGDPVPQPSTVVISGSRVDQQDILFNSSIMHQLFTVDLNDDQVSLEDVETYALAFSSPSDSRVGLGQDTVIIIRDDDVFTYGIPDGQNDNLVYPEDVGTEQVFMIDLAPSARNLTFMLTSVLVSSSDFISTSLDSIECGQDSFGLLRVSPSLESSKINCTVRILDDGVAHEDNEVYNLTIRLVDPDPSANPTTVDPSITMITLTIEDDDVSMVVTDAPQRNVTEGDIVMICVYVTPMSVRNVSVILRATDDSARDGEDFISGGESEVTIPAGSGERYCTNYTTLMDNDFEGDEEFDITIVRVSLPNAPPQATPPAIGPQGSTTIQIVDIPPASRMCRIDVSSQMISTFGDSKMYPYARTCEHTVLLQQTPWGEFGVFIESLDGTLATTRVGLRIGPTESVVISVYNRTIIRQNSLSSIQVSTTPTKLSATVSALDFQLEVVNGRVNILVGADSSLTSHNGLCGSVSGDLLLRNGTLVDTSDSNGVMRFIGQQLVPPSETFLRMVVRQECGLTGEDLETGDPMFVVPLYTPSESDPHSYSLCYEIHGYKDETYNFISDECVQVNGHYYETTDPDPDSFRAFHGVDRIEINAVNNMQQCVRITVSIVNNVCSTSVGGSALGAGYLSHGISIRQTGNRTRVSVPNCADNTVIMNLMCRDLHTSAPYIELRVVRGLNLRESSHGLIGQFWNVPSRVTKYEEELRDGTVMDNVYLVEMRSDTDNVRSFIGFKHPRTWNMEDFPCIYVGNAQGGPIYEAADGEPNDSVIEGSIHDYSMADFKFNQFSGSGC